MALQSFEIIGQIRDIDTIATGHGIRGSATVRLDDGTIAEAEVHWYEAHGIGKRWMKIKRYLD